MTNYKQFIQRIAEYCYKNENKTIRSAQSSKYRHKMTYDFSFIHEFGTSDLGIDVVNDLCAAIYNFAHFECTSLPFSFWSECMVQHSRTDRFLIKLMVKPSDEEEHRQFVQVAAPQLIRHLIASEKFGTKIESIVYQKCPSPTSKPSKYAEHFCLFGNGKISHSTAFRNVPLSLSCDTFCEAYHFCEFKQFEVISEWLADIDIDSQQKKKYSLVAKGREIIPYVLEIHKIIPSLKQIVAICPCKHVHRDSLFNFEQNVGDIPFFCYYSDHNDSEDMTECCRTVCAEHLTDGELIFIITAGRNGLSRKFVEWIKSQPHVDRIIYSSCNQKVTFRELQWFLDGDGAFFIDDYRILEMHPSTPYFTFFALFKRKKILIVPIGAHKVGKTHFIEEHLQKECSQIAYIHRDKMFFGFKGSGLSLKEAKKETHKQIVQMLTESDAKILYFDSTNTQREARLFYLEHFQPNKVIFLNFVMDEGMNEQQINDWLRQMVQKGNEYRMKCGVPISDKHKDIESMVVEHKAIWDGIQRVNKEEINQIQSVMTRPIDVVIFDVNATDFDHAYRANLCYDVLKNIFCNK